MILGIGRGGSTHLQHLLDSHPDIRCYEELFTRGHALFECAETTDHHEYLDDLVRDAGARVVGFKHMWPALYAYPQTFDLFHDPAMRIIRLKRWNLLALHVSMMFVEASGVAASTQGRYKVDRIRVDLDRCFTDMQNCYFVDHVLDEIVKTNPVAEVTYEHLVDNADEVLDALQRFLGVEPRRLRSPHERLQTRPLVDAIENWDEVSAALRGTAWEQYLEGAH